MSGSVLLVDNDRNFVKVLTEQMQAGGMEVSTAISADTALEMTDRGNFDVIVLSLMLPETDGFETVKAIKKVSAEPEIILLTTHTTVEKGIKAMKSGATDVLSKSTDLRILTQKIAKALTRRLLLVEKRTRKER